MKIQHYFLALIFSITTLQSIAGPGDTVTVQTFTFGSPQNTWFVFPSDTMSVEKIYMKYTLKCNPAQTPACGEWDYLTYSYLYDHTGLIDSSIQTQASFVVSGSNTDTLYYGTQPYYLYQPTWQTLVNITDTTSLNTATLGTQSVQNTTAINSQYAKGRSQNLWKASDLIAAGLTSGNITGLRFNVNQANGSLRNFTLRIKATTLDSLQPNQVQEGGWTTVYSSNTTLINGTTNLQFTTPFNWNGTSNIIIDISYDNNTNGTSQVLESSTTSNTQSIYHDATDRVIDMNSGGYVTVPLNNSLAAIDSFVTVSFWAFGDVASQPMDGTCFEAVDSLGNRILNSHTPWSDGSVYWDAGFEGTGYDRINKAAAANEYAGKWNHWAFTKNTTTGSMKIYLNGVQWHSGTGKTKDMHHIKNFKLARGNWGGSQTYKGRMDDFAVFNKELSLAEIQSIMFTDIDASNPLYANLAVYYDFNDGNYVTLADNAPGNHAPATIFQGDNPEKPGSELQCNFKSSATIPNVVFEQGVFTSTIDTVFVLDSVLVAPTPVYTYAFSTTPTVPIDTLLVWPQVYNYLYDSLGLVFDSVLTASTDTMYLTNFQYYNYFEKIDRHELARYITPYGNNLSLGTGWTWTFDVSDYRTLLHDSVHLAAGNWQELLDMKFEFIKGTPPRPVLGIQTIYAGGYDYGVPNDPIDNHLTAKTVDIASNVQTARWKSRITGHGMDTPENCAEFCPKTHYFKVNGTQQFSQLVWRDNCDRNPLYPQGGTWVYDRANWCPGAEVWTYDFELTPFITAGSSLTLDHDVQPYTHTGGWDYYQIEDQIVTYGAPNFTNDAALEEILSPSTNQMYGRINTVCTNPIIKIKNTGSANLTSLTITYGLNGATQTVYNWTGNLKFMEIATVTLGNFNWAYGASYFDVTVSNPNGVVDEYGYNNHRTSAFVYPPVMPNKFVIECKTNLNAFENRYTLKDASGTVILNRDNLTANTTYRDTIDLAEGCYEFELLDTGEDGLSFWANTNQGSGFVKFKRTTGASLKGFNADFGGQVYQQFTVGLTSGVTDYIFEQQPILRVYPNPAKELIYISFDLPAKSSGLVKMYDVMGNLVEQNTFENLVSGSFEQTTEKLNSGVYIISLITNKEVITQRVIISK